MCIYLYIHIIYIYNIYTHDTHKYHRNRPTGDVCQPSRKTRQARSHLRGPIAPQVTYVCIYNSSSCWAYGRYIKYIYIYVCVNNMYIYIFTYHIHLVNGVYTYKPTNITAGQVCIGI